MTRNTIQGGMKRCRSMVLRGGLWVTLFAIFTTGCDNGAGEAPPSTDCRLERFAEHIDMVEAEVQPVAEQIPLTGLIEANPDKVVHFVSLVDGVISRVLFSLGDAVRRGEVMAEIRSPELSKLHAEGVSLRSRIKLAESTLSSVQSMYEDGVSSKRDLLAAEGNLLELQAELESVEAVMNLYGAAGTPGVFQIRAPVSGFVTEKRITPGTQISAGDDPLFTLADLSEVWVLANVYAGSVKLIEKGLEVGIRTLSYPGEVFSGTISSLSHVFDQHEKVLKARIVLDNPRFRLKPGMLSEIDVTRPADKEAVAIPTRSLIFDNNRNYVVIYHDACTMEARKVELLLRRDDKTFIASGIEPGEKVLLKNQLLVFEELKSSLSE